MPCPVSPSLRSGERVVVMFKVKFRPQPVSSRFQAPILFISIGDCCLLAGRRYGAAWPNCLWTALALKLMSPFSEEKENAAEFPGLENTGVRGHAGQRSSAISVTRDPGLGCEEIE